ncbi:Bug family tripartite tricarboxylate transporter substrate binding protein [Polaromonas sp.]|uniref:Bug family tripartite tricarboxylate transporter substrate binding protein n=1 Tax=Polaromonas sp. TaxID=1869339 RepID=UPI003BA9E1AC
MLKTLLKKFLAACVIAGVSIAASAQTYPARPIKLIVPYAAGGTTDILGRMIGQKLQESMGQPVVVENKPGAATNLGAEATAKAVPDGYTLLLGTNVTFAVNPHLYEKLAFDPLKDFAPIAPIALTQTVLLVNPSVPAHNVREVIALAKAQPGKLSYGSYGSGSLAHLAAAQFAAMAGVQMVHVPYKGSAPAMTDLVGGHINLMFDNIVTALPNAKSGKVRALAVTGARRSAAAPDLPTVAEGGVGGYEVVGWFGFAAPAGTPPEIVRKLNSEINRALAMPDVRDRIISAGADPMNMSSETFAAFIRSDYTRSGIMVKTSGAKAE